MKEISFDQNLDDVVAAAAYMGWESPDRKKARLLNKLSPLIIFLGVAAFLTVRDGFHWEVWIGMMIMAMITFFLMDPIARVLQRRRLSRMISSGRAPTLVGKRTIQIAPDQVKLVVGQEETVYTPSAEQSLVELPDHFLLFVKPRTALILPKRAMGGQDERQKRIKVVQQFLEAKVEAA